MWFLSSYACLFTIVNLTFIFIKLLKDFRFMTVFSTSDWEEELPLYKLKCSLLVL